jgi:hypothetical protein
MEEAQIPKKIISYNTKGKRNIGCPQLRWRVQHTLKEDGIDNIRPNP